MTDPEPITPDDCAPVKKRTPSVRRFLVGLALGAVVGVPVVVMLLLALRGDVVPLFADETFEAAQQRWNDHRPGSYEMTVEIRGNRPGEVRVEVRSGQPISVVRDGQKLTEPRLMRPWTVPGLFEMVDREAELAEDPQGKFGAGAGGRVTLRVAYDAQLGYPTHVQRFVEDARQDLELEVIQFQVQP